MSLNTRSLDRLFRALGIDSDGSQALVLDTVQPVYVIDDVAQGLPNRATITVRMTLIPSSAAGEFASFELNSTTGFWLKRLISRSAANWVWSVTPRVVPFITTIDPQNAANIFFPEGSQFATGSTLQFGQTGGGAAPRDSLGGVASLIQGHSLAGITFGCFEVQNAEAVLGGSPLWVPPGIELAATIQTAAVVGNFELEVEFPANAVI